MAPASPNPSFGVGGGVSPEHMEHFGRVIRYLEGLTVTQGAGIGQPFRLMDWQREFLAGALRPGVYEAALTMARGGGKTTLVAGVGCAALEGPLQVPNSEVLIVAASLGQGRICFRHVLRFLEAKHGKLKRADWRIWDTVNRSAIYCRANGVLLELKGCNPRTVHGCAPSLIVCDEMAQWEPNKVDAMIAALETGLGKVPGSRIWKIGTRAATRTHPFSVALLEADYRQVHAAEDTDPPFDPETWRKACPSLCRFPDLERRVEAEARKAKHSPEALAHFRALRLNLGTADTMEATLVEPETWERAEGDAEASGPVTWGVDMGGTAASTAVAAYWPLTGRMDALAAFPGAGLSLAARGLRDGVGSLYTEQHGRGELLLSPGHAVDPAYLLREALNRFGRPVAIASDRWREGELRDALDGAGVPLAALTFRGQGYKDGGQDVRLFQRAILEGRVTPVPNLVLRSAMAEARITGDPAGNWKLCKGSEGQRRQRARDDAAAAAILSVAEGVRGYKAATIQPERLRVAVIR